jgi:hypothetical protein
MPKIKFTIEGPLIGTDTDCKRGVSISYDETTKPVEYLEMFREALDALWNHEVERLANTNKTIVKEYYLRRLTYEAKEVE